MFELSKQGFNLHFKNGNQLHVDFGPMSESENKNRSAKEFASFPKSGDAEVRLYTPASNQPKQVYRNVSAENFVAMIYEFGNGEPVT
jgi:hypothetical protein